MGVAAVTLDNPPANSYDLEVMRKFAADVDGAIDSDARVVLVRSASEKLPRTNRVRRSGWSCVNAAKCPLTPGSRSIAM